MTKMIFLGLCFLSFVGCATRTGLMREPDSDSNPPLDISGVADRIATLDLTSSPLTQEKLQKLADEKPWTLFQSQSYCGKSYKDLETNAISLAYPAKIQDEPTKTLLATLAQWNKRTYDFIACDEQFHRLSASMVNLMKGYEYNPILSLSDEKLQVKNYRVVGIGSMLEKGFSYSIISNLADRPIFKTNNSRTSSQDGNKALEYLKTISETDALGDKTRFHDQYAIYVQASISSFQCNILVYDKTDKKLIDAFKSLCLNADSTPRILTIGTKLYIVYIDFDLELKESSFRLRMRQIKKRSMEEIENDRSTSADATILYFPQQREMSTNADVIPTPTQIFFLEQTDGQKTLFVNLLLENAHWIYRYDFNQAMTKSEIKWSFQNPAGEQINIVGASKTELGFSVKTSWSGHSVKAINIETAQVRNLADGKFPNIASDSIVRQTLLYPTFDGRKLPIVISYNKDFKKFKSKNFGILRSYGGFNQLIDYAGQEHYLDKVLLDKGGFAATAVIRGGGELGPKMWRAAYGQNRDTSFKDFIAASEFLVRQGFTQYKRLAIHGGSNGGLLVLAAAHMRPDIYGAVISRSPVANVINTSKMDQVGGYWEWSDYGDMKDPEVLKFWERYSPVQNVGKAKSLPPILIQTASDDKVVSPQHVIEYVLAARSHKDSRNIFMMMLPNGYGHNPPTPQALIEESSYNYSFIFKHIKVD